MTALPGQGWADVSLALKGEPTAQEVRAAIRAVAGMSRDADDCRQLLDALGLDAREGR
jgi:hypothetical protein